jgi:nucleotidyltransferase/DNA polymerase involved in DNA repair
MGFSNSEKQKMLALKGVGETVIARLEQIGFSSLAALATQDPLELTRQISQMLGSTCWHNSPQARRAITDIVALAIDQAIDDM